MNLNILEIDSDVEATKDYLPGNFGFDTGIYKQVIDMAYMGESAAGSVSVTLRLKEVDGDRTHEETVYVTTKKDAAGKRVNTFTKNNVKRLLPGMDSMNQLALIALGQKLSEIEPEVRTIKKYNWEAKKELNTDVPCLVPLIGKVVTVALTKCRDNKSKKVGNDYVDLAEERISNEITKFLHEDGLTVLEKEAGETTPIWRDGWLAKCPEDFVRDRYTAPAVGASVEAASANQAEKTAEATAGLFDD